MSDPAKYRPEVEAQSKKKSDPLTITEERLTNDFGVTEEELKALRKEAKSLAKEADAFAQASADPNPNSIYDFVYAD